MEKITKLMVLGVFATGLIFNAMPAFAKHDGNGGAPSGFSQGNKKGWNGKSTPPGWSKKSKKELEAKGVILPPGPPLLPAPPLPPPPPGPFGRKKS